MAGNTPRQAAPAGALDEVNRAFHSAYSARRDEVATDHPVIVFMDHTLILVWREQTLSVPVSPSLYHELKAVAHAPVAAFAILYAARGRQLSDGDQAALSKLQTYAEAAAALAQPPIAAITLQATAQLVASALDGSSVDEAGLVTFAKTMGPALLELTEEATSVELAALHAAVEHLLNLVPAAKQEELQVVVVGEHQARDRSLPMQYFRKRLQEKPGSEDRVAYAEGISTLDAALALVGTRRFDRVIANAFFGDPKRLQRDVLGDAAKARLDAATMANI